MNRQLPPSVPRGRFTPAQFLAADPGTGPVHNEYFMPVGPSAPALHAFKGTLTIGASSMSTAKHGYLDLVVPRPGFTVADDERTDVDVMVLVREAIRPFSCRAGPGETFEFYRRDRFVKEVYRRAAILILIFDDPELPTLSYGCYDVSLSPQAEEEAV